MTVALEHIARRPRVPLPGEAVEVRGSLWAVTDVKPQELPRSPADDGTPGLQHQVTVQSLEDGRMGEELVVVWELEVGHAVHQKQGIPERLTVDDVGEPSPLGALVDALRWGAVTSADHRAYQAPFRSGVKIEPYQLEPLRRALSGSRANLLLADDVGLGKTIEAGLVVQELLLRHRARTVVIVCPPGLAIKWQDEMRQKFGLEFVIVNSECMAETRRKYGLHANPLRMYPRVILSMTWLPMARAQRLLREIYSSADAAGQPYAFDALIVDEAHHVAPAGPSRTTGGRVYAVDSQRTIATRALAERCEHRLFLSATPHNGYPESFTALLEMVDNRRFSRGATLNQAAKDEVMVRRLKTQIASANFKPRELVTLNYTPAAEEEERFAELERLLLQARKSGGSKRANGDALITLLLIKRFLSSPFAFATTLRAYIAHRGGQDIALDDDALFEVLGAGQSDEEEGREENPEAVTLRRVKGSDPLGRADGRTLNALCMWGEGYSARPDSRLLALVDFLDEVCRPQGKWGTERVVVFTEYVTTLEWIRRVLEQRGYGKGRLATIDSSVSTDDRERIRDAFTIPPQESELRVLLATDSAGEGIDLQKYCHRLVNYDIPFNPSRLEQRIGRIDRYGQEKTPTVFTFLPAEGASSYRQAVSFVERILVKTRMVKSDLGSANEVVNPRDTEQQLAERFAGVRKTDAAMLPSQMAARRAKAEREVLAGERDVKAELTRLATEYDERTAELHLRPGNLERVLRTGLRLAQQTDLRPMRVERQVSREVFQVPQWGPEWEAACAGLDTIRQPKRWRPVTFAPEVSLDDHAIVRLHLGHALMQKAARTLRSSLFRAGSSLHRVTAVALPELDTTCVAAVSRVVLVGRGGIRLHEEVLFAGVRANRHSIMSEERVEHLLSRVLDDDEAARLDEAALLGLLEQWNDPESTLRTRLEDRVAAKAAAVEESARKKLEDRLARDVQRAESVFATFESDLRQALVDLSGEDARGQGMIVFADDAQQAQWERDRRRMQDRLHDLGAEQRREIEHIRDRYADVRAEVTHAALVFAVPDSQSMRGEARA